MATKEIDSSTRKAVLERQNNRSISGAWLGNGAEFHHAIHSRGASGVGYEWNIVALTPEEHMAVHEGADIKINGRIRYKNKEFRTLIRNHLLLNYANWSEDKCLVHKGWSKEDYHVARGGTT